MALGDNGKTKEPAPKYAPERGALDKSDSHTTATSSMKETQSFAKARNAKRRSEVIGVKG